MKCENCDSETPGGYCDCMIVDGDFKGTWWLEENDNEEMKRE
ncbi:hypothetical protein [Bacillus sp. AFS059628]|nr:hypothetical protein [Bacillus sp. AFS059628]